jgi:uracil-DNA glycosylase
MADNPVFSDIIDDSINYLETLKQYGVEYFNLKKDSPELLNYEIMRCRFCSLDKSVNPIRNKPIPPKVKVLFVVDMPKAFEKDKLFPEEEKNLFKKILSAMNLRIDEIFVIPVLRCMFSKNEFIEKSENFSNLPCFDFFKRALTFIDPFCICFLGKDGFETINKNLYDELSRYPFFSTYSLNDLNCNPSLKKESWEVFKDIISRLNPS